MLVELDVLKVDSEGVTIGYEMGSDQWAKAKGNILGTYGNKTPIPGKARNFLGIEPSEIKQILKNYPLSNDKKREKNVSAILEAIKIAKEVVGVNGNQD